MKVAAGLSILGLLAGVVLTASVASAQAVCAGLDQCRSLRARVHARITALEEALISPTRTAYDANGQETIFIHDTTNAALGEAWRDPSGMIWGNVVKTGDDWVIYMDQQHASSHCESIGAQLPSREDFARLRGYMGATTEASEYFGGTGYKPQVLPNLYRIHRGRPVSINFWSALAQSDSALADVFYGRRGDIGPGTLDSAEYALRCVVPPYIVENVTNPFTRRGGSAAL